ncbi:MAG: response regulator transcription factor, partial [Dehalococcoidia bacterium]
SDTVPAAGGLTSREVDVLRRPAAGSSNKQIADALVLSVATVRGHTISIYGKIGTTGRTAAAAYALRHGILPPDSP